MYFFSPEWKNNEIRTKCRLIEKLFYQLEVDYSSVLEQHRMRCQQSQTMSQTYHLSILIYTTAGKGWFNEKYLKV